MTSPEIYIKNYVDRINFLAFTYQNIDTETIDTVIN